MDDIAEERLDGVWFPGLVLGYKEKKSSGKDGKEVMKGPPRS